MYHGTHVDPEVILQEGLVPGPTEKAVHLTVRNDGEYGPYQFQVDLQLIDVNKLRTAIDWYAYSTLGTLREAHGCLEDCTTDHEAAAWNRAWQTKDWQTDADLIETGLREYGYVAYDGVIPPEALTYQKTARRA